MSVTNDVLSLVGVVVFWVSVILLVKRNYGA